MFNDDESFTFKKMHELSTGDGFVEVAECMAEMIKYVANEPSVGLFYIQQHIQNAVPNVVNLKNKVANKSREMVLHTEDAEDSISVVRSMKEYGHSIADEMIKDIESSLALVSATQPKRGLISSSTSAFKMGRSSSWGPVAWTRKPSSSSQLQEDGEKSVSYLSNVIKSAKDRASYFRWPQMELNELSQAKGGTPSSVSYQEHTSSFDTNGKGSSSHPGSEIDELPLSSQPADEELLSLAENFNEFTADRESKLELWLAETRN